MNINTWSGIIQGNFSDRDKTWFAFISILNRIPHLTILTSVRYDFPYDGMSGVVIIGESHAAIHTWPEEKKAWVELATCGDPAAIKYFKANMENVLPMAARDLSVLNH